MDRVEAKANQLLPFLRGCLPCIGRVLAVSPFFQKQEKLNQAQEPKRLDQELRRKLYEAKGKIGRVESCRA